MRKLQTTQFIPRTDKPAFPVLTLFYATDDDRYNLLTKLRAWGEKPEGTHSAEKFGIARFAWTAGDAKVGVVTFMQPYARSANALFRKLLGGDFGTLRFQWEGIVSTQPPIDCVDRQTIEVKLVSASTLDKP